MSSLASLPTNSNTRNQHDVANGGLDGDVILNRMESSSLHVGMWEGKIRIVLLG